MVCPAWTMAGFSVSFTKNRGSVEDRSAPFREWHCKGDNTVIRGIGNGTARSSLIVRSARLAEPAFHLACKWGRATDLALVLGKDDRRRDREEGVWLQPFQVPRGLEAEVHR